LPLKILIVGAYGTFGGRLVDLLADESRLELVVAGRSGQRAADFCSHRNARARLTPTAFDRNSNVSDQIRALAPDVLVDASGPFQSYGERRYDLVEACIARRAHYLDLADGSEFVAGVSKFDVAAGPVPEALHRALVVCAWLVRWRLLPSLSPFAGVMSAAVNRLRWGEHRGGMFVQVRGTDEHHREVKRSWHLLAEGDDGPFIPSMAIEAIIRKMLAGQQPAPGARAAVRELELSDYEALFASRTIYAGIRDDTNVDGSPLFERLLGEAWHNLPGAVRQLHTFASEHEVRGRCTVEHGRGLLSSWIASLVRFPPAGDDVPVSVHFRSESGNERWTRQFGQHRFASTMLMGRGRSERLLCERIGPIDFAQALVVEGDRLRCIPRRWSIFGIPLPLWLAPRSNTYETEENGTFRFHVDISHPWIGLIVRYRGWLKAGR